MLSEASAETLCRMILDERITMVICNGIEDEYYQYPHVEKSCSP